jgi:predicted O-methyltransferase YrrM
MCEPTTLEKNHPGHNLDDREILADLSYGWGNPGYSANLDFLLACAQHAAQSRLPVLECGSGITTIITGIVAQKYGNTVWSLEHMKSWHDRLKKYLELYKIDSVKLIHSPLADYGDFTWYRTPLDKMPDEFSLVICDGPPANNKGGRYGLMPIMKQKLAPGCVILFDNANRKTEQENVARWEEQVNMSRETHGSVIPYYVIRVK